MSKPWRMVTLHVGAWILLALLISGRTGAGVMDWTCWVVIGGCVQTIGIRLARMLRALGSA